MTIAGQYNALLRDITEAFHAVFDVSCTAVVVEDQPLPVHCL